AGEGLPVIFVELGLRTNAVARRDPAVHEEEDDALRARRVIEPPRIGRAVLIERPRRARERLRDEAREREHAEAVADAAERVAPRERLSRFVSHESIFSHKS